MAQRVMAMAAPSTPLARDIYLGTKGLDVVAVKRALSRAGYMQWGTFTQTWGDFAKLACHNFQKDHNLRPAGYGPRTHDKLLNTRAKGKPGEWAYDNLSIEYMHTEYVTLRITPEQRIRALGIQMCRYLYEHSVHIGYSQGRPSWLGHLGDPPPDGLDCSGLANVAHYAGGARNPNIEAGIRLPWNGEGYTGTLIAGGTKTTKDKLKPLDLVFYGFTTKPSPAFSYGAPTHVAVWEGDQAESVFSMGHYPMGHYHYNYGMYINCFVTYNVLPL